MPKLFLESELRPALRKELDAETYEKVSAKLRKMRNIESIPVGFIKYYAEKHDPVCRHNLENLIIRYNQKCSKEGGEYASEEVDYGDENCSFNS